MRKVLSKFLSDRGTHLAAMIAYFALLAFVPLLFLVLSVVALTGEPTESSYLVQELQRAFPKTSVDRLLTVVTEIRKQAKELSIVGGIGLFWAALGFFSVLESAFNIVYGVHNRPFFRGKALALVLAVGSIFVLFIALVIGSIGVELVERAGVASGVLSYVVPLLVSTALIFVLVWGLYHRLTNVPLAWREVFPGALAAAVLLQASFQILPLFVRLSGELVALQAYGGLVLMLVWLYLMANVIVLGAELNWWIARGRGKEGAEAVGLA